MSSTSFQIHECFYLKFFDEFYQADMVEAQAGKTEYAFWPLIHFVLVFGS